MPLEMKIGMFALSIVMCVAAAMVSIKQSDAD